MGKVKGKHRLDKFYHLAKEHGYRSRASWKLVQLDSKHDFLRSSRSVLDLCAAPGGWMQVAVQRVPVGSLVLGIDLVRIAPLRGAVSIEQDITKPQCKDKVKDVMAQHGVKAFDLVLHDGSPNIGGAWAQEAMAQNALVIDALKLATQFLAPKANFVTKVFRSQDYSAVLYCLNQLFEKVEVDKPAASRSASAEIFVLGLKYKAPAKIDRRLLDVKHLFQGSVESQPKVVDVLGTTKQKRHRDGYEDGATILRKVSSAADFIWSETPLEVLGSVTSISFNDPSSLNISDHVLTTDEIKILCDDLRVLGKQDFKHLLKWRMHLRKSVSSSGKTVSTHAKENEGKDEEDEDDKVLNEMEELTNAIDRKKKREKKLLAKRRAKDKARKTTGMQIDALEDGYTDNDLFSLSAIKGKKDLVAVDSAEYDGDIGVLRDSDDENTHDGIHDHSSSDMDSDEERKKYDKQMEEFLDEAYERFVAKREGSTKQRKRAKQAHSDNLLEDNNSEHMAHSDYDSDKDHVNEETNPLMVLFSDGKLPTQKEITDKWFGQNIFAEAVEDGDLEKDDSQAVLVQNGKLDKYESIDEMKSDGDFDKYDSLDEMPIDKEGKHSISKTKANNSAAANQYQLKASKESDDFEIVHAPVTDSSDDSSEDESDVDVDTKAEILACAKKMLRKKTREQMLDDAYNKYMFHDEGLPAWFLEEEKRHRQPVKPITKEEIAAMRAQFKEINARPAKKVAEAKDRKKRAAMRKLEKVRKKANAISEQADINDRSKRKLIEQLYKRATPKRPKKEYVVAKKGVSVKVGKGKVLVDPRLKKDTRTRSSGKPGKGGSKKGKNAKVQKGKGSSKGSGGRKGKKMGMRE